MPCLISLKCHQTSRRRLVEPLCGGLAVSLGLMPERALLNDVNPHNVNFFRWLRAGLVIEVPMANEAAMYYRHRDEFNALVAEQQSAVSRQPSAVGKGKKERGLDRDCFVAFAPRNDRMATALGNDGRKGALRNDSPVVAGAESKRAAELFYYLNRTGYNGLCRFNRKGEFNVPFGRHATINYTRDFTAYADALAGWEFRHGDFEALDLAADDFIYADPPYDVEFTQYTKEGFGWEGQVRLARWLSRHPGPVVLSNQATPRVLKLYRGLGFDLRLEEAPRMISCNGDRTKAIEVIASRNL